MPPQLSASRKIIRFAGEKLAGVYVRKQVRLQALATSAAIAKARLLAETGWRGRLARGAKLDDF
jgi:hypothetical protein